MEKIIKKFITFERRKFDLQHLLASELIVYLPPEIYRQHQSDDCEAQPQEKGLFLECIFHLLLSRMYADYQAEEDCYASFDGSTNDGTMIDFKFTGRELYYLKEDKYERARMFSIISGSPFHFVLASPVEWNDADSSIKIKIHHIITFKAGVEEQIRPLNTTKRITIYRELGVAHA